MRWLSSIIFLFFMAPATWATELVMIQQHGCHWCERWDAEIAPAYPKTSEGQRAPLRRIDLHKLPEDIDFKSKPVFTPTFVLVEDGKELGRLEGYPGQDFFWPLLAQLLDRHSVATASGS